jgi:anti-sigma factor ChrR (cupin superfamily)
MAHDRASDELSEALTLHALELLGEHEDRLIEQHVACGCEVCRSELRQIRESIGALALAAPLAQPSAGLRDRVLETARPQSTSQVWKEWGGEVQHGDLHVVRKGEGPWEVVAPGVSARRLYVDRERDAVTMMVRMDPGASYVPHRHAGPEQCFVLEGDLFDGQERFYAGDFQCAAPGSVHHVQSTEGGCLLLIVSSLRDELIA